MVSLTLKRLKTQIINEIHSLYSPIDSPGMGRVLKDDLPLYYHLLREHKVVQDWITEEEAF